MPGRVLRVLIGALAAVSGPPALAGGQLLDVAVDHARVLKIPRPAETIIIGNPAIVDVTVNDATTLVLTGRSYGLTNLVVLDAKGLAILDESVAVGEEEAHSVRIFRQSDRTTYSCTPNCQPSLTVGDQSDSFASFLAQVQARESVASGASK